MSVILDGQPLTNYGLCIVGLTGWLAGPEPTRGATGIPGLMGTLPAPMAVMNGAGREIQVEATKKLYDVTDRAPFLALLREALQGERRLTTIDRPREFTYVHCTGLAVEGRVPHASMWNPSLKLTLTFTAYDGASYDAEPRVVALTTSGRPIEVGTLPSDGLVYLTGAMAAGATRQLIYSHMNGEVLNTMTLTAPADESLGANDHLELDGYARTVTRVTAAGARYSAEHWFTDGYWCTPDPKDANRLTGGWPWISVSAGAGTFLYRRAWRL